MVQHFLLSAAARTLSLATVLRMSEEEAFLTFRRIRWAATGGAPVCPKCGCTICYDCRRTSGTPRFRCRDCRSDFSVTSGTLFHGRKLPMATYLAAVVLFLNEVKGKNALALGRDLDVQHKTAFVLAHKLREAMAHEMKGATIGGPGREAEIDGAYFGGHVRPENEKKDRKDRRLAENQTGKRQVVVVIRERDGRTVPAVFPSEDASLDFIKARVAKGTVLHADESPAWNVLHARYVTYRIDHGTAYSLDGACTNGAE